MKTSTAKLTSLLLSVLIILSSFVFASCSGNNPQSTTASQNGGNSAPASTGNEASTTITPSTETEAPDPEPVISETVIPETIVPDSTEALETGSPDCNITETLPSSILESSNLPEATPLPETTIPADGPETQLPPASESEVASESTCLPETQLPPASESEESTEAPATQETPSTEIPEEPSPEAPDNGYGATDVSYAASRGILSTVGIYCTYEGVEKASAGSGVIYSLDGDTGSAFIITNYHVVYSVEATTESKISSDISVFLYGLNYADFIIPATYVGGCAANDIAVLHIKDNEILKNAAQNGTVRAATVTDSEQLTVGSAAIAVGNAEALGISVTSGIISVPSETLTMTSVNGLESISLRVIRIDAAVNSGNSGGGLFNAKGELIGIVTAKIKKSYVENIGYAIPTNLACALADNIIDNCFEKECKTAMRCLLGVTVGLQDIVTEYDPEAQSINVIEIIAVSQVNEGSLAEKMLVVGDVFVGISLNGNSREITKMHHVTEMLLSARVGDTVAITVIRNGETVTVDAVITEDCFSAY